MIQISCVPVVVCVRGISQGKMVDESAKEVTKHGAVLVIECSRYGPTANLLFVFKCSGKNEILDQGTIRSGCIPWIVHRVKISTYFPDFNLRGLFSYNCFAFFFTKFT